MNQTRIVTTIVGVLCLTVGALLGWVAATQRSHGDTDAGAIADAVRADKAAASRAAVAAEGWAHVANATYSLAKYQNAEAQAARKQTRELAARAERAAARAEAIAAHRALSPAPSGAAPVAVSTPTARPKLAVKIAAKPAAGPKASDESCRRAAIYERTAANASLSRQAAYNAVRSGIAVNAHCSEPERGLIEGYLLAQRASAESALKIGDWKSDLSRSDRLLADCVRHPEHFGTAARGCRERLTKNERIRRAARHGNEPPPARP